MNKFEFSLDFQWDLIKFVLNDRFGDRVLKLINHNNFTLTEQSIIYLSIELIYKKFGIVPKNPTTIKDQLLQIFRSAEYHDLIPEKQQKKLVDKVESLFNLTIKDGSIIYMKCKKFASYIMMKDTLENFNLTNYDDYDTFYKKIYNAISVVKDDDNEKGTFLIKDIKQRQFQRQDVQDIVPTPFKQINNLTNAGGYSKGSIIVLLDKPKNLKTTTMINIALGYLRMRKKIFVVDFENGQEQLALRMEQALSNKNKKQIISGESDSKVQKILRKYNRLKGEIYIKRFPTSATMADVSSEMDIIYNEHGIRFDIILFEYLGLMRSVKKFKDETEKISQIYIEASDLALEYGIEHIYSTHHVTREAKKREYTRYVDNDIAKCIDIVRHAQVVFGLNRSDDEKEAGVLRMELVVQRDGKPDGKALFTLNADTQKLIEFTQAQRTSYDLEAKNSDDFNTQTNDDL